MADRQLIITHGMASKNTSYNISILSGSVDTILSSANILTDILWDEDTGPWSSVCNVEALGYIYTLVEKSNATDNRIQFVLYKTNCANFDTVDVTPITLGNDISSTEPNSYPAKMYSKGNYLYITLALDEDSNYIYRIYKIDLITFTIEDTLDLVDCASVGFYPYVPDGAINDTWLCMIVIRTEEVGSPTYVYWINLSTFSVEYTKEIESMFPLGNATIRDILLPGETSEVALLFEYYSDPDWCAGITLITPVSTSLDKYWSVTKSDTWPLRFTYDSINGWFYVALNDDPVPADLTLSTLYRVKFDGTTPIAEEYQIQTEYEAILYNIKYDDGFLYLVESEVVSKYNGSWWDDDVKLRLYIYVANEEEVYLPLNSTFCIPNYSGISDYGVGVNMWFSTAVCPIKAKLIISTGYDEIIWRINLKNMPPPPE